MSSLLKTIDRHFEERKHFGAIFIRIIIGWRLIDGSQDNVFSWARMLEFRDFLEAHHVPAPLLSANVSVYAQFSCGILYILGAFVRPAAFVMIINFIAALAIAHLGTTFQQSFEALMMLSGSLFFLFYGAGKISVDEIRKKQK
jgi:putative oxidoreductase